MLDQVSFADLKLLRRLSSAGSINQLARELRVTQPALSRKIALLEHRLGGTVFVRGRGGVRVTAFGQRCIEAMREVDDAFQVFAVRLGEVSQKPREIRIGAYDSFLVYCYPTFLAQFAREANDPVQMRVHLGPSAGLIDALRRGELDLAVAFFQGKLEKGLSCLRLGTDDYGCFASPSLADGEQPHDRRYPWISYFEARDAQGLSIRQHLGAQAAGRLFSELECPSFEVAKECTRAGLGYGLLPWRVATPLLERGELREVTRFATLRKFGHHEITLVYGKSISPRLAGKIARGFRVALPPRNPADSATRAR